MRLLTESISQAGILVPVIVRKLEGGTYQLISGHRRRHACELLGIEELPAIVREADEDEATIMMVDSNFQREIILPSEKAKAYKMKLDAIKRQGERTDLTCGQLGHKLEGQKARDIIAETSPDSARQIQRYIRLNELIPELLAMVDEGRITLTPAVELSYLNEREQNDLLITIDSEQATPSLSQAIRMKKRSQAGILTETLPRLRDEIGRALENK